MYRTGASSGIGKACALEFARHHANLILSARRKDRLTSLVDEVNKINPKLNVHYVALDVRDRNQIKQALDELPAGMKDIDILINNAGLVHGLDTLERVKAEDVDDMINTNLIGAINMLQSIIPILRKRSTGHIINMGSIAGVEAYGNGAVYCATKHALNAISKALLHELMDTPIRVSEIKPGMVETEFSLVRFNGDADRASQVYQGMDPLTAQDIAETVSFVASRPPHVNIADMVVLATSQAAATKVHRRI